MTLTYCELQATIDGYPHRPDHRHRLHEQDGHQRAVTVWLKTYHRNLLRKVENLGRILRWGLSAPGRLAG